MEGRPPVREGQPGNAAPPPRVDSPDPPSIWRTAMSIRILTATALLATVALRPALAQGDKKPDFSGTWKVNTEKSDPMGGGGGGGGGVSAGLSPRPAGPTTITQSATELVISTSMGDQTRKFTYSLDGKETTNPGMRGGETKSKAHWDGNALVIENTSTMTGANGEVTVTSKEVRTLSEDGKTMTVVTTRNTPTGEQTTKRVYDKQ